MKYLKVGEFFKYLNKQVKKISKKDLILSYTGGDLSTLKKYKIEKAIHFKYDDEVILLFDGVPDFEDIANDIYKSIK